MTHNNVFVGCSKYLLMYSFSAMHSITIVFAIEPAVAQGERQRLVTKCLWFDSSGLRVKLSSANEYENEYI